MNPAEQRELEELQSADAWDWETSEAVTEPGRGDAVVQVRFSGDEFDPVDRAAEQLGVSVIQFIREAAIARATALARQAVKRRPSTG
jgi:hypothetical protein